MEPWLTIKFRSNAQADALLGVGLSVLVLALSYVLYHYLRYQDLAWIAFVFLPCSIFVCRSLWQKRISLLPNQIQVSISGKLLLSQQQFKLNDTSVLMGYWLLLKVTNVLSGRSQLYLISPYALEEGDHRRVARIIHKLRLSQ